ncbi:hypothetical protein ACRAWD_18950 [Caulobacter segnis]
MFEFEHRCCGVTGSGETAASAPFRCSKPTARSASGSASIPDITEQKAAAEKLRESEALFRTLADAAPAPCG